jgi:hypothetical protein
MTNVFAVEVGRLHRAAELLSGAASSLPGRDPGRLAFGADGLGRLGALGDRLHDQLRTCLEARSREASVHAERLNQMAAALRRAAGGYSDVDDSARRRTSDASTEGA